MKVDENEEVEGDPVKTVGAWKVEEQERMKFKEEEEEEEEEEEQYIRGRKRK